MEMEVEEIGGDSCFTQSATAGHQVGSHHQPTNNKYTSDAASASASGCFDCNICLDFAAEPVVTLCGHLYCWPCIYKWLQRAEQCPVCKASLSQSSLVPLYGRGYTAPKQSHQDIPRRPASLNRTASQPGSPRGSSPHRHQQHFHPDRPYYGYPYGDHVSPPASPLRTPTLHYTSGGVLGGMAIAVLPWMFRNQEYLSPYSSPPRVRRQEMQVERSLQQIWVFFCCCALLCLLLF